jgi:hypothetical protein
MRKAILFLWLLIPVALGAYHYGPGQDRLRADKAAAAVERAQAATKLARETAAKEGDEAARPIWSDAEAAWGEALDLLPPGKAADQRALRLERAKAQMFISKLPDAHHELESLVDEIANDPTADASEMRATREALANAQYYTTWLMRLEGAPREEWEPEIEASRQNYKLLAEDPALKGAAASAAPSSGDEEVASVRAAENLESAIRLERMSLTDLQGLPLPSQ